MALISARETGYVELMAALKAAPAAVNRAMRDGFREAGGIVAADAAARITGLYPSGGKSADYRPVVRLRSVDVDQPLRKTTGARPDWGATQMRLGLVPALRANEDTVVAAIDVAIDAGNAAVGLL